MAEFTIRPAEADDWPVIVEFNCRLASETEGRELDRSAIRAGVQAMLADAAKGRYWLACLEGRAVGQIMHTREWSDWRNGDIWWLQSVYVLPDFRRQGVFRALYEAVLREARGDPGVVGLRLYVERQNGRAQSSYERVGMEPAGYLVMEQMFA